MTTDTAPSVAPRVKLTLDLSPEEADFLEDACYEASYLLLLGTLVAARRKPALVAPPPPTPPKKAAKPRKANTKTPPAVVGAAGSALGAFASHQLAGGVL